MINELECRYLIVWLTFQKLTDYLTETEIVDIEKYLITECYEDYRIIKLKETERPRCK